MSQPSREPGAVERRRGLSPAEFFAQYARPGRPVVLEDVATSWKERWTPEMLKERFGDRPVVCETKEVFVNERHRAQLRLADFVDRAAAASLEYRLRSLSFLSQVEELQSEFQQNNQFEEYFEHPEKMKHMFWISPPNNTTLLHHDTFFDNLNVQVYGRKRFVLLPPSAYRSVYTHYFTESPILPLAPDLKAYPRFARVETIQETVLEPGEVLFIPQFWWHHVTALELSININTWVKTRPQEVKAATAALPPVPRWIFRFIHDDAVANFMYRHEKRFYDIYNSLKKRLLAAKHKRTGSPSSAA